MIISRRRCASQDVRSLLSCLDWAAREVIGYAGKWAASASEEGRRPAIGS